MAHNPRESPSQKDNMYESTPVHLLCYQWNERNRFKADTFTRTKHLMWLEKLHAKSGFAVSTQSVTTSETPQRSSKHFRHPLRQDTVTGKGKGERALRRAR